MGQQQGSSPLLTPTMAHSDRHLQRYPARDVLRRALGPQALSRRRTSSSKTPRIQVREQDPDHRDRRCHEDRIHFLNKTSSSQDFNLVSYPNRRTRSRPSSMKACGASKPSRTSSCTTSSIVWAATELQAYRPAAVKTVLPADTSGSRPPRQPVRPWILGYRAATRTS